MAESWVETPYLEEIQEHVETWIGQIDYVLHEIVSEKVHIDVLVVKPTDSRPFYTLITAGMSALPMPAPDDLPMFQRTELMISLPADNAFLSSRGLQSEANNDGENYNEPDPPGYYPIRNLKEYARYPHLADTWIGPGHTLCSSNPPTPLATDTAMTGYIVGFPYAIRSHEGWSLEATGGATVSFLQLYPIHTDELEYKMKNDSDALFDKLEEAGALECFDANRPSVIRRTKWFGLV